MGSSAALPSALSGTPTALRAQLEGVSLGLVLTLAREHLGVDALFLTHVEDGFELFVLGEGEVEGFGPIVEGGRLPLDESYCNRVLRDHLPDVIADTAVSSAVQTLAITHQAGIGSYVGIPVRLPDGTIFGTICCVSHQRHRPLSQEDLELMTLLARLVGEEIGRRQVSTAIIAGEHRVGRLLAEWRTIDSLLEGVLERLAPVLEFDTAGAWLVGGEGGAPDRRATAGPRALNPSSVQPGEAATMALGTGRPAVVAKPASSPERPARTGLAIPLRHEDRVLGVLEWRGEAALTLDHHAQDRLGRIGAEVGAAIAGAALPAGRQPSPRELQVLQLAADGYGAREIAADLHLSPSTVRTHLRHVYGKLHVSDRAAAVAEGLRHRLIV